MSLGTHIDVWIVEDDVEYRDTITYILDHTDDVACSHAFSSYEGLSAFLKVNRIWEPPGLVLMDIGLPGLNGIEAISMLKGILPDVPILMLTISDSSELLFSALSAGASGYLLKDTSIDRIVSAIREATRGGMLIPPNIADRLLSFFKGPSDRENYPLTPRENEVLKLMSDGLAHKQIAEELFISHHTVENHCRRIYHKLHVHSGVQAVSKALKERIL